MRSFRGWRDRWRCRRRSCCFLWHQLTEGALSIRESAGGHATTWAADVELVVCGKPPLSVTPAVQSPIDAARKLDAVRRLDVARGSTEMPQRYVPNERVLANAAEKLARARCMNVFKWVLRVFSVWLANDVFPLAVMRFRPER